jgi:hypothetical protein
VTICSNVWLAWLLCSRLEILGEVLESDVYDFGGQCIALLWRQGANVILMNTYCFSVPRYFSACGFRSRRLLRCCCLFGLSGGGFGGCCRLRLRAEQALERSDRRSCRIATGDGTLDSLALKFRCSHVCYMYPPCLVYDSICKHVTYASWLCR